VLPRIAGSGVQASRAPRARRPEEGWSAADARSLKASRGRAHNLPVQLTSFIGRQRQIDEIRRLLGEARLVTLTGAGGVGKKLTAASFGRASIGRVFGWIFFSHTVGAGLAAYGGGFFHDVLGDYHLMFISAGILGFVAAGLSLGISPLRRQQPATAAA